MTVQTMLPRGIRNNNPLNIRLNPDNRWQGRVPPKHKSDGAFEQFQDPVMGLRAAAVLLIAHYDRHLDTIRKLVQVWAPPNENDTESYARCVAKASGFGIDEPLDLHDYACLRPILTAMIRVENGKQRYTDAQIDAALVRPGVMPLERSLQQTRTVKGGQVAAAGTIGAGAIGAIQKTVGQAHDALAGVVPYLDTAKWGLLAVTLIGIGVMLWARIDDGAKACADVAAPPGLAASQCAHTPGMAWRRGWRRRGSLRRPAGRPQCPNVSRTCDGLWKCNMTSSRLRAVVPVIAASLLAGSATAPSDGAPCPPVVEYSREFLGRAADDLVSLPAGSAIEQMLADYQVMREQARICAGTSRLS